MQIQKPAFFIGYDSKEDIAYRVCKQSLLKKSSIKINVLALKLYELVARNYYKRIIYENQVSSVSFFIRCHSP